MKVYNQTLLHNAFAQKAARRLHRDGKLSASQLTDIQKAHADVPYNPNIFIKILLFLFGWIGFGFGGSMLALFVVGFDSFWGFAILSAIYGVAAFFMLFHLIRERKFHFSGIDNALIYCILGTFLPLLFQIYESVHLSEMWIGTLLFLPFLLVVTYLFGEPLVTLGTFVSVLFILASLAIKNPIGKALLPFILMIFSAIVYWQISRFLKKATFFYWEAALEWVSIASLIVFYAAGNYYVVREANAALNALPAPAPEIAFASIFWAFTFITPILYFYMGFHKKDRILLVFSLLSIIASILTFRFYHGILPTEWGLVLGGVVATAVAVSLIQYLKNPRYGFSNIPDAEGNEASGIETFVLSQVTQNIQSADHGLKLGGGDFGGGGAGGNL